MRATRSDDMIPEGAFVSEPRIARVVPPGFKDIDPFVLGIFDWALMGFAGGDGYVEDELVLNRRRLWLGGAAILLVVGGIAAYLLLARPPVAEVLGVVSSGGQRVLREPMRAPGPGPRVIPAGVDIGS